MAGSKLAEIVNVDQAISHQIYETASQIVPLGLLKALEISGDGRIWIPIPIAVLLAVRSPPAIQIATGLLVGFLLDLLFVGLLKHLVRRSRPKYNSGMYLTVAVDHWSFPSGHSSRVFFISAFLFLVRSPLRSILAARSPPEILLPVVFFWSSATAASRILLGRHFVSDVVVGVCLGVIEALLVFRFFDFFFFLN
ncbi:putative lipid phosphate phosphatase beta [Wolffia australiana]